MSNKFKIGDQVNIVDTGFVYTTFKEKFQLLGFKDIHYNSSEREEGVDKRFLNEWMVFGFSETKSMAIEPINIYAIRNEKGRELLIGEGGIVTSKKQVKK